MSTVNVSVDLEFNKVSHDLCVKLHITDSGVGNGNCSKIRKICFLSIFTNAEIVDKVYRPVKGFILLCAFIRLLRHSNYQFGKFSGSLRFFLIFSRLF